MVYLLNELNDLNYFVKGAIWLIKELIENFVKNVEDILFKKFLCLSIQMVKEHFIKENESKNLHVDIYTVFLNEKEVESTMI